MYITNQTITKGFIAAGAANIAGVLISSRLFTNAVIPQTDPAVMSNFGLLMIVLWGIVFLSVAKKYATLKWLVGAFVLEKLIYGITWTHWMAHNDLSAVYAKDTMAGVFYTIYGVNDWIFFIFFTFVFIRLLKETNN